MMALVMKRIDNNVVSIKEILQLVMCSHLLEEVESQLSKLQIVVNLFTVEAEHMIVIQACNAKVIGELIKQNQHKITVYCEQIDYQNNDINPIMITLYQIIIG